METATFIPRNTAEVTKLHSDSCKTRVAKHNMNENIAGICNLMSHSTYVQCLQNNCTLFLQCACIVY